MASVRCVAGSGCVEIGQECVLPLALSPAQASNFGDGHVGRCSTRRAARHRPWAGCGLVEDVSHLLGAVVGDFDTDMRLICREGCAESFLYPWEESSVVICAPARKSFPRSASQFLYPVCQTFLGSGPLKRAVGWPSGSPAAPDQYPVTHTQLGRANIIYTIFRELQIYEEKDRAELSATTASTSISL